MDDGMTLTSNFTIDRANGTSAFNYGSTTANRTITYDRQGFITLPGIVAPLVTPVDDFERLTTNITDWIDVLTTQFSIPLPPVPSIASESRTIGAKIGGTWECASSVTYYGGAGGTQEFSHQPGVGITIPPRPSIRITWANLIYRNRQSYYLLAAAKTGLWPTTNEPIVGPTGPVGPAGPQGPQGIPGPSDPLVAWAINSVNITKTSTSPSVALGGTWVLLASGNLLSPAVGTVWAWRRTA